MFWSLNGPAIGVRVPLPELIGLAQRHGFKGVDFNIEEAATLAHANGLTSVQRLFGDSGVAPTVWGVPVAWRGDEVAFAASLTKLADYARLSEELGCTRTIAVMMPFSDERPYAENYRWSVEHFKRVAEVLQPRGIRLGLEYIGPKTLRDAHKNPFIYTLGGCLDLNADIGTGNIGVLFDAWHWYTSHGTPADFARIHNADIVHVHINDAPLGRGVDEQIDNQRALPGQTGVIDITAFLRGLADIGYDGGVAVEPFSQAVNALPADEAIAATVASLRKVWQAAGLETP
jgi:sugar phosphate isomerase/epimerase